MHLLHPTNHHTQFPILRHGISQLDPLCLMTRQPDEWRYELHIHLAGWWSPRGTNQLWAGFRILQRINEKLFEPILGM